MGLNLKRLFSTGALAGVALASFLVTGAVSATAQPSPPAGGQGGGGTGVNYVFNEIQNSYLTLYMGYGSSVAGGIGVWTNPGNAVDPFNALVYGGPIQPTDSPVPVGYFGGWLYVRIDNGTKGSLGGKDYLFGDSKDGGWIVPPTQVGNQLQARWVTKPFKSGTGGGTGGTAKDVVEVDFVGSFIHDTVRFSFTAKNLTGNAAHKIGLAFVQDIAVQPNTFDLDGPLRLTGRPYLHNETLLSGGQIPTSWSTYVSLKPATANKAAQYHSIKGILYPTSSAALEPTPPTRFIYGRKSLVEGSDYSTGTKVRNYEWLWDFANYMDPTVVLDKNVGVYSTDAATAVVWDQELVPSSGSITKITYLGSDTSTTDFTGPMTLSVSGPPALGFATDRTDPNAPFATAAPNPFVITAFVQNITDLNSGGNQFSLNTVNCTIDLPPGLILASGETNVKTIKNVLPGSEGLASWSVMLDPNNPRSGSLLYTVTATPDISNGKGVQRTVEVPAPTTIVLDPDSLHPGFFKMRTFPLLFGTTTPSQALGLPQGNGITPQIDTRQFDPNTGHYLEQPNWVPGFGYWVRYNPLDKTQTTPKAFTINAAKFPPLDQQVQPTGASYKVNYPQGWNQIGDPYVYDFRFSEMQVFNPSSLVITNVVDATSNVNQWLLPAVYHYNTEDPDATKWYYELEPNLGFTMKAGEGYWLYVLKDNLQFIYNGVDVPGASVTRSISAKTTDINTTLGKSSNNNWRLNLVAKSAHGTDALSYIGVAPAATDGKDTYKWAKPPVFNPGTTMDIIHQDWATANGRYAQDLRAPGASVKTWNLIVTAPKTDKEVTITWPAIAASVPRAYELFLVDPTTNAQHSLRDTSSYTLALTPGVSRSIQIIAKQTGLRGVAAISSFSVIQNNLTKAAGSSTTVTFNYALTAAADTQINVRDSRGRIVRSINGTTRAATDATSGNVGQVVWDVKDQKGVSLSAGSYQAEIVAVNTNGQRSRQVKPFILVR